MSMSPEASRVLNFLAGMPQGHTAMTKEDLAGMLLETGGTLLACGRLYNIETKHLGVGVYRVSLKLANP